jgi:hypothetical protein
MRWRGLLIGLLLLVAPEGRAAEPLDVALVLVNDVSRSVSDQEFEMMKAGYKYAFTDPQVVAAMSGGPGGGVAVSYVEFAGAGEVREVIGWTVIRDGEGAAEFAAKVAAAPRSFYGRTAIGDGIDLAMRLLAKAPAASRRVIDVAGDGTANNGRSVIAARDDALAAGVTINGLAIANEHPTSWAFAHVQPPGGLPNWYRENVTGGPGSFVLDIHDFHEFGQAMRRKLLSEIALR